MSRVIRIDQPGLLTTVQDTGRPGHAVLGVPESGAVDQSALRLANRLVGNREDEAGLEVTFGGLSLTAQGRLVVAVTGAPVPVTVSGRARGSGLAVTVPDGATLELGSPWSGVRSYLAIRGGLEVEELLGSASVDILSGLGAPLQPGDTLAVGTREVGPVPSVDQVPESTPPTGAVTLRLVPGPRWDWFTGEAHDLLAGSTWTVQQQSNRVGLRLKGPALEREVTSELASEGVVAGSLQVPASGQPVLFLADHPVTGGYPVIGVVPCADLPLAAHLSPGQEVRFRCVAAPDLDLDPVATPDAEARP